jgi:hypothetical protein
VYAPAGRTIDHKFDTVAEAIAERTATNKRYNYGGSWYHRTDPYLVDADALFLEHLRAIKKTSNKYRFRVEEPNMQIYAESEKDLQDLVKHFKPEWRNYIEEVTYPVSADAIEKLKAGAILRKNAHDYSHKVMLRDGRYELETKQQILNYLDNLGDLVKLSKGSREMLTKNYTSMWGVFFYTNDPSLVTFLSLINPNLVSNIHELIHTEQ